MPVPPSMRVMWNGAAHGAGCGESGNASLAVTSSRLFPEPVTAVPGNATLRERTRALVAARLDQTLPNYLKSD